MNPYQASGVTYKTYMEYVELCALLSSTQVVEESRTRLAPAHQVPTQGCQCNPTRARACRQGRRSESTRIPHRAIYTRRGATPGNTVAKKL